MIQVFCSDRHSSLQRNDSPLLPRRPRTAKICGLCLPNWPKTTGRNPVGNAFFPSHPTVWKGLCSSVCILNTCHICLVCNYVSKLIPALQSRCTRFCFAQTIRRPQNQSPIDHCCLSFSYHMQNLNAWFGGCVSNVHLIVRWDVLSVLKRIRIRMGDPACYHPLQIAPTHSHSAAVNGRQRGRPPALCP